MLQSDQDMVRTLPLFHNIEENSFNNLMADAEMRRVPHHETLILDGTLPHYLLVVVDGAV